MQNGVALGSLPSCHKLSFTKRRHQRFAFGAPMFLLKLHLNVQNVNSESRIVAFPSLALTGMMERPCRSLEQSGMLPCNVLCVGAKLAKLAHSLMSILITPKADHLVALVESSIGRQPMVLVKVADLAVSHCVETALFVFPL